MGSGPAGLTAAWQLARKGYQVKIFEKRSQPGGFLRHAIPVYRLPHDVVDADIAQPHRARRGDRSATRRSPTSRPSRPQGYDAVIVATGTQVASRWTSRARTPTASVNGLDFLADVGQRQGPRPDRQAGRRRRRRQRRDGRRAGGRCASARPRRKSSTAAAATRCRRTTSRPTTPRPRAPVSSSWSAPLEVLGDRRQGRPGSGCRRCGSATPDASGRRSPEPIPGSEYVRRVRRRHLHDRDEPGRRALREASRYGRSERIKVDPRDAADARSRTCSPPAT